MLLTRGMNLRNGNVKSHKGFVEDAQNCINREILSRKKMPPQWHVPLADKGKSISEINLLNLCTWQIVNIFELLTQIVFSNENERAKWNEHVLHYRQAIELLHLHNDFEGDDAGLERHVQWFQGVADKCFRVWAALVGIEGLINYIHMIGRCYHCLYKYEQQGLNSALKTFYFCQTKWGGTGNFDLETDGNHRLTPIGHWLQQWLMWKSRKGSALFLKEACEFSYINIMSNIPGCIQHIRFT